MKKQKMAQSNYFINNPKILKRAKFERSLREIYLKCDIQQNFRIYISLRNKKMLGPMLFDQKLVKEKIIKLRPRSNL
jgi:hypothetical protein